jgi:hypothetical protein
VSHYEAAAERVESEKTENLVKFSFVVNVIHFRGEKGFISSIKMIPLSTQKYRFMTSLQFRPISICYRREINITGVKCEF